MTFRRAGVPAVQLFGGPSVDYHRPTDTPEKIDAAGLEKVAALAAEVVGYLAGPEARLSAAGCEAGRRRRRPGAAPGSAR